MKNCTLIFLCCIFSAGSIAQQQVHSFVQASLNDKLHTIDGFLSTEYTNHSIDTLQFIWFQLWPNAYKNDRTAYSEKMLDKGITDFYFSDKKQKGYINRLDFRSGNTTLQQEDHPMHIDIVKVYLDKPLPPGNTVKVTTPFHVQLPYNFSGMGHVGRVYSVNNWFPAPALYKGSKWFTEPYIGPETVSLQKADLDVLLTLPIKYIVETDAALMDSSTVDSLKTIHYRSQDAADLAWSAGTRIIIPALPAFSNHYPFRDSVPAAVRILSKKIFPAIGYNRYDGIQLGLLLNNITAHKKISYYAVPLYAFASKRMTGLGGMQYSVRNRYFTNIEAGVNGSAFSTLNGNDSLGKKVFGNFYKISPYIKLAFPASAHIKKSIEFRTFIIGERELDYNVYSADSLYYPSAGKTVGRYLNQISFNYASSRVLYPYSAQLQMQQAQSFYRLNATAKYFFNYPGGGGMQLRLFAAKFGYLGEVSSSKKFETVRYQPKLTGVRGAEDYTYSDYFTGRNEFDGINSQQIMMRDGGLKIRTDLFQDLQGRSDNWVASMNLNTTIFNNSFPVKLPLRVFLDAGTYAGAWQKGTASAKFLYVAGLQLSLFKDQLNIYAPVLFSREFRDNLKTVPEENRFFRRISFSFDINRFNPFRMIHEKNKL